MANPVLSRLESSPVASASSSPMTLNGTVARTAILLLVCLASALAGYFLLPSGAGLLPLLLSAAGAVGIAIWAARNPLKAKVPAFAYALLQGFLVGSFSHVYVTSSGTGTIIAQALLLTAVAVAATLVAYVTRLVRVTQRFRSTVIIATMTIAGYYLLALVLTLVGVRPPLIYDSGPWGIVFSLIVLLVACSNLFLDYAMVEQAVERGTDEQFEWFAAFGLTVTILWVYMEILRLLSRR